MKDGCWGMDYRVAIWVLDSRKRKLFNRLPILRYKET